MKILKVLAAILLVAVATLPLIPVEAADPTYTADINVDNTSSTNYTSVPVKVTIPNFDYLVANGYITADGTDIQVTTLGGSKLPRMLNEDGDLVFLAPSLPANSTSKFKLTLGNTPEDFAIITDGVTILDSADMDPCYAITTKTSCGTIVSVNGGWGATYGNVQGGLTCGYTYSAGSATAYYYRSYVFFDTSSLPDGINILSAKLKLYVTSNVGGINFDIVVQNGQPTYPHDPLEAGDYYRLYYSGNGGSENTSNFVVNSWTEIDLNSDGIEWINEDGTTKLCLRTSKDINNEPAVQDYEAVSFSATGSNAPVLYIEYDYSLEIEFKGYIDTSSASTNTIGDSFISTASDGRIYYSNSTYATARSSASGTVDSTSATAYLGQQTGYSIQRSFLFFDTSSLPDDVDVLSAKLKLYVTQDSSVTDFDITIQNGQPTYPHNPLQATDYNMTYYSGNGGSKSTNGISINSWIEIPLNATALEWINKTGTTKLCLRSSRDVDGITPTGNEYIQFATAESTNAPVLEIGYYNTLVNKPDSFFIGIDSNNTVVSKVIGGPQVSYGPVDNGEHTIKVTADGSYLKLYIDGILRDSESFTDYIPDTTSNWIIGSGAMSRISYYKHTVGGVLKAWYQPNSVILKGMPADNLLTFPTIVSTNSKVNASTTSHTLDLPATRNVGDLLIASISTTSNPTITWPTGWTLLFTKDNSAQVTLSVAYRIIDGSETDSITITTSAAVASSCQSYAITDYSNIPVAGVAVASYDPPSLTSGFGNVNTLWLAVNGSTYAAPAIPASYTDLVYTGTASPWLHSAYRNLRAASEDPGIFTSSSYAVSNTLAVCPLAPYIVTDRAGGDQKGILSDISNPDDVTTNIGVLVPYNIPTPQPGGGAGDVPVIVGESGQPGWTEDTPLASNPFYPAVAVVSDVTDIPERQIWVMGALMCVTAAMLAVFKFVPHQLITVIVGGIVTALFVAQGILPFWVIFIFVLIGIAIVLWERVPSV